MSTDSVIQPPPASRTAPVTIYELSICARVGWVAHSMSNIGSGGTNRLMPRSQMLAYGINTDAGSGAYLKHKNAMLVRDYMGADGQRLCSACSSGDTQRAASLVGESLVDIPMAELLECGLCDTHGFMIPAKKAKGHETEDRKKCTKESLVEFGYALALPDSFARSWQIHVRSANDVGAGQMIMKVPSRSGIYALCVRYRCAGIGMDNNAWRLYVPDANVRLVRHRCVLRALRDQVISPDGALTAGMLPHLTSVNGIIAVKTNPGRAPIYSPLEDDFDDNLLKTASEMNDEVQVFPFSGPADFVAQIQFLIANSHPGLPSHVAGESA